MAIQAPYVHYSWNVLVLWWSWHSLTLVMTYVYCPPLCMVNLKSSFSSFRLNKSNSYNQKKNTELNFKTHPFNSRDFLSTYLFSIQEENVIVQQHIMPPLSFILLSPSASCCSHSMCEGKRSAAPHNDSRFFFFVCDKGSYCDNAKPVAVRYPAVSGSAWAASAEYVQLNFI